MSALTCVNSKSLHGGYKSIGTYHSLTIPAVTSGNSLAMILALESGESLTTAPSAWNGTVDTPLVYLTSETAGSTTWRLYQLDNVTTAPTSIRWKLNAENYTYVDVFEIGGTGGVAPTHKLNQKTSLSGDGFTFSQGYTTTTPNEFVIAHLAVGGGGTQTPTAPFTLVTHGNYGFDSFYNANAGAAGSKTLEWSSQHYTGATLWLVSFGNSAAGPTVSTITGTTATEGSAVVFTVTMSGTGGLTDAYSWSGTAGSGDYTQTLTDGMFTTTGGSGSVTVSGGNIVVPSAVTEFTVTVPTTGDTLDEANETIRLVFGGVTSSSGTINDDDAPPTITGTTSSTVTAGSPVVITYSPGLSGQTRTYTLALTDGTAVGGTDYDNTTVTGDFAVTAGTGSVSISGPTVTVDAGVTEFTLTITTTA